jgi:hemerythrin superfamily protein
MTDVVELIEQDHRELEGLFDRVLAGDGDRQQLLDEITSRLEVHARAEELEVYPVLTRADPGEKEEVEHANDEHHEAEYLLRRARALVVSPHFDEAFTAFVAAVKHHVEEEETDVLPALREAVDGGRLAELGTAFDRVRRELLAQPAAVVALMAEAQGVPDAAADDLADATRDELYERAKAAEIPGRSGMTKQELAEALRDQG